ncbi:MAG: GDSL-type esterase/lipase family protein [Prevotellaceae bacterium]|nr:GDSL-type esterase/lipase family protein [Prevotellaceae bacterium]
MKKILLIAGLICMAGMLWLEGCNGSESTRLPDEPTPGPVTHNGAKAVFIGDDIFASWAQRTTFWSPNDYICKGAEGEVTKQIIDRFNRDVIELDPHCVVIMGGASDLAQNTGYAPTLKGIVDNMAIMASRAKAKNIRVIFCSVTPAASYSWSPGIQNVPATIVELNTMIKTYAGQNNITYVDFHALLKDADNALQTQYQANANDGVHLNSEAYIMLEPVIKAAIENTTPPDATGYDVTIYLSDAARTKTFEKTGVNFRSMPSSGIILNPSERYQTIDGFGAAITGATAVNLLKMSAENRAAFLKETFDPEDGVGFSYVRISIGASDFSLVNYTHCDNSPISNFAIHEQDRNYVIPVLQEILTYNPALRIMGSPWTCPRWMKVLTKGGSLAWNYWIGGYLKSSYYSDYATYFVNWIKAYQDDYGIPIYSITPQNEPLNGGNTASLQMYCDEQRDFIKTALGPQLRAAGLNTEIYVFDHNYNYDDISSQAQYPLKIYEDAEAAQYVTGAAYHNYGGDWDELNTIHNARPDKGLLFTEASIGDWHDGRNLNSNFTNSLKESLGLMKRWCKGVIVWNLMLDMNGGPQINNDSNMYGAVDLANDNATITRNCHYYEVGHMSVVVKPGATRIKSDGLNESGITYEAFENADGSYALVVLNETNAEKTFTVSQGNRSFQYTLMPKACASMRWM